MDLRPLREEAEVLKRELLTAAQFLLRDEPQILAQLSAVSDGDALDDLVEDLNVLVTIAKSRPSKFSIVDLTGGTQKAIARAKEIATRLATECEGERHEHGERHDASRSDWRRGASVWGRRCVVRKLRGMRCATTSHPAPKELNRTCNRTCNVGNVRRTSNA